MAPSATETETTTLPSHTTVKLTTNIGPYKELAPIGYSVETEERGSNAAKYQNYLPHWEINERYPPLTPFTHRDHGLDADPTFPDLLPSGVTTTELTPTIGTEVTGVQLSKLSNKGKDQLARFVAERKVVAFRDQDFKDLPISEALDYGRYFGRLHVHPTSGAPKVCFQTYLTTSFRAPLLFLV
jgi:sulfonate dioxygenase